MIKRFQMFMGPAALRIVFIWIAATGLLSLILNVIGDDFAWVRPVQTLLALAALIGGVVIVFTRLDALERRRWFAIVAPALGAVVLAFTVLPQFQLVLLGAAAGWLVAGSLLFRTRTPTAYRQAIRHLRRNQLDEAVRVMDDTIRSEPKEAAHYQFRAELLRVWGKLDRSRRDYQRVVELLPQSPVGYNGLAEVQLQAGDYADAQIAARRAAELAPGEWVALYNLGMIQDRLGQSEAVIDSLTGAAAHKVPDARHRVLIDLYLTRAYARLGRHDEAAAQFDVLRKRQAGLDEWQKLLTSDQADTLKAALGDDIAAAAGLLDGTITLEMLAAAPIPAFNQPPSDEKSPRGKKKR